MDLFHLSNIFLNLTSSDIINIPNNIQEHMCQNDIIAFSTSSSTNLKFNCLYTYYNEFNGNMLLHPSSNYVFVVNNTQELEEILFLLTKNKDFNFKGSTLILTGNEFDLLKGFEIMWSHLLSTVIVGIFEEDSYYFCNTLTDGCGEKIDYFKVYSDMVIEHYNQKYFNNCILFAKYSLMPPEAPQYVVLKQLETNFRTMYANKNISLIVLPGTENSSLMNREIEWNYDYLINVMNNDGFDFVLGLFFFLNLNHLSHQIEHTQVYLQSYGIWIFPLRKIAFWKTIISAFTLDAWVCMGIIILLCTIITYYVLPDKNMLEIVLDIYKELLGGSSSIGLEDDFKLLFLMEIIFCFYVNLLFQAVLNSILSVPIYEKIENVEDLLQSNMKIKVVSSVIREMPPVIAERCEPFPTFSEDFLLMDLEEKMDFATVTSELYKKKLNSIHGLKEFRFMSIFIITYIRKGHYLLGYVNRCIGYSSQFGFISKHVDSNEKKEISEGVPKLSLEKLESFFVILMIGLVASFVVFLGEKYVYYSKDKRCFCSVKRHKE